MLLFTVCEKQTLALVPGRFLLRTAEPSAMTISTEYLDDDDDDVGDDKDDVILLLLLLLLRCETTAHALWALSDGSTTFDAHSAYFPDTSSTFKPCPFRGDL